MVEIERNSAIGNRFISIIEVSQRALRTKEYAKLTHDFLVEWLSALVELALRVLSQRANHWKQSLRRGWHAANQTRYQQLSSRKDLRVWILYCDFLKCYLELLHDCLDNAVYRRSKKLRNLGTAYHQIWISCAAYRRGIGVEYPGSFICPKRMSDVTSLSRDPPNLIYCGSSTFLNLGFVVLSKQVAIWSTSSTNFESDRNSVHQARNLIMKKSPG